MFQNSVRVTVSLLNSGLLLLLLTSALFASSPDSRPTDRSWLGKDGTPLPFKSDEEVMDFLREAEIVDMEDISEGVTRPRLLLLEKDGIVAHAILRDINEKKNKMTFPRKGTRLNWRDSCRFECAAYALAKMLDLYNIPPVVVREVKGGKGTVQIWIEKSMNETARRKQGTLPPDILYWKLQEQVMHVFDALIFNDDRNTGNWIWDQDWNLWMIDHTRAFVRSSEIPKKERGLIKKCERNLFEKIKSLDEDLVKERLEEYLESAEIKLLCKRRAKLIAHLDELIAQRGEESVLFEFK